jgi:hypothetical protein
VVSPLIAWFQVEIETSDPTADQILLFGFDTAPY